MTKGDLIRAVCKQLQDDNIRKPVKAPKQVFKISDDDGHESNLVIRGVDRQAVYNNADVSAIINTAIDAVLESLRRGEEVYVQGFGTLRPHYRAARKTISPSTHEEVEIPAHYVPKFVPGSDLKRAVKLWEIEAVQNESDE